MLETSGAVDLFSSSFLDSVKDKNSTDSIFYAVGDDIDPEISDIIAAVLDLKPTTSLLQEPRTQLPPKTKKRSKTKSKKLQGLDAYYLQLGKFSPFTVAEEVDIFRTYNHLKNRIKRFKTRRASPADIAALERSLLAIRNEIVERNLRFVVKLSKSFWGGGDSENFENLVSAGNIGLIRAIDRFDTTRGVRFLTYAANWIALEVRMEIANDSLIKIPIWWQKTLRKLAVAFNNLSPCQEPIANKTLALKAEVPLRHLTKLSDNGTHLRRDQLPQSRPAYLLQENLLPHADEPSAEEQCIRKNAQFFVLQALDKLKPQERLVIHAVYGLDNGDPQNLRQVSNVMGNTGERVRQLKEKGLESLKKKLLSPSELGGLGISHLRDIL